MTFFPQHDVTIVDWEKRNDQIHDEFRIIADEIKISMTH